MKATLQNKSEIPIQVSIISDPNHEVRIEIQDHGEGISIINISINK